MGLNLEVEWDWRHLVWDLCMPPGLPNGIRHARSTEICVWVSNCIHVLQWDVITQPCPYLTLGIVINYIQIFFWVCPDADLANAFLVKEATGKLCEGFELKFLFIGNIDRDCSYVYSALRYLHVSDIYHIFIDRNKRKTIGFCILLFHRWAYRVGWKKSVQNDFKTIVKYPKIS